MEASNGKVILAYVKQIEQLEQEKLLLAEKLETLAPLAGRFDDVFEHAWRFLSGPWRIWAFGSLTLKRTVLRLTFWSP